MLKDEINAIVKNHQVDAGLIIQYGDKNLYEYQADKVFPAAGLISLGLAAYIEKKWQEEPSILDEQLEVTDLSRVHGSGVISRLKQNQWPIRDLLYLMMALSDNAATNLLIERFDIYEIDDWLQDNYPGMRLGRELMRYSSTGQDNEVTAKSMNKILLHFLKTQNEFSEIIRKGMENQTTHFNLGTFNDNNFPTYNKIAILDNNRHEVSAFKTQTDPLLITVLSQYSGTRSDDLLFLQDISKTIFSKISVPKPPKFKEPLKDEDK